MLVKVFYIKSDNTIKVELLLRDVHMSEVVIKSMHFALGGTSQEFGGCVMNALNQDIIGLGLSLSDIDDIVFDSGLFSSNSNYGYDLLSSFRTRGVRADFRTKFIS